MIHRLLLSFLLILAQLAGAQTFGDAADGKAKDIRPQDVIQWDGFQATADPLGITVGVRMSARDEWTIYAKNLSFIPPSGYTIAKVEAPKTIRQKDPISDEDVDVYAGGEFTITLAGPNSWHGAHFPLGIKYVGCTKIICLFPYTQNLEIPFVSTKSLDQPGTPLSVPDPVATPMPGERPQLSPVNCMPAAMPNTPTDLDDVDLESQLAKQLGSSGLSYGTLLVLVLIGGLISNFTPCVYPMIPITLRLLARQGSSAIVSAIFYALGIVVTYSSLALIAAASGSMFGKLLASPTFNIVFAIIMVALGISMLGFGNFAYLQALGSRLGAGTPSRRNTFLMGAGAGLVAAPCTGPILAALLAYTARGEHSFGASTLLMVSYSLGFALPYVLLGGAAAKVSAIRVPPAIQIGTKILFASIMLGLALYYLRIPLYEWVVLMRGKWAPLAIGFGVSGLILLIFWTLSLHLQNNKMSLLIPTTTLAVGIFSASQWATDKPGINSDTNMGQSIQWIKDESQGLAAAQAQQRPILIDMWAEWCEACKKMDQTTFSDATVITTIRKYWTPIKLDLTESTPENEALQAKYSLTSLPTLVLLPPDGNLTKIQRIGGYVNGTTLLEHLSRYCQVASE